MVGGKTFHGLNNVPSGYLVLQSHKWTIFLPFLGEFSRQNAQNQPFVGEVEDEDGYIWLGRPGDPIQPVMTGATIVHGRWIG
jgi:hypothetical protein